MQEGIMKKLFKKKRSRMMIMTSKTLTMTWFGIMHLVMLTKRRSNREKIGANCLEIPAKNHQFAKLEVLSLDHEDAYKDIEKVLEIVDLFHIPNITQDQVMLRPFPMSLTGAVIRWLRNKPSGLITTWEDLKTNFLRKYCPPARTAKKIEEINKFQQEPDEIFHQAWKRFKKLLMKHPQHYLTET
nr:hypothetical protein [Tanacetum cinerariifolium]